MRAIKIYNERFREREWERARERNRAYECVCAWKVTEHARVCKDRKRGK